MLFLVKKLVAFLIMIALLLFILKNPGTLKFAIIAEIKAATDIFGPQALEHIASLQKWLLDCNFGPVFQENLEERLYLATIRLLLPISMLYQSYIVFALFAFYVLYYRHLALIERQGNLHLHRLITTYLLNLVIISMLYLSLQTSIVALAFLSCLYPLLILLSLKKLLLTLGFAP